MNILVKVLVESVSTAVFIKLAQKNVDVPWFAAIGNANSLGGSILSQYSICLYSCNVDCAVSCPPCKETCEYRCRHSRCRKKCCEPCVDCVVCILPFFHIFLRLGYNEFVISRSLAIGNVTIILVRKSVTSFAIAPAVMSHAVNVSHVAIVALDFVGRCVPLFAVCVTKTS